MKKVLVATESRHGATAELGRLVGQVLEDLGHDVDVRRIEDVESLAPYDAFVVGSAVYMGSWPKVARAFVESHREELSAHPTWLFSSGPVGRSPDGMIGDVSADELVLLTGARDHHVFGGKLDQSALGVRERAFARFLRVREGDYREWGAAVAWATAIGRVLADPPLVAQSVRRVP
ncbi:MAG TPA: flavodoxin domain-containing protein [Gaiellaceae bacterium]|nr:flavodoxin domain-containing protein [Gaiellaceae bacterium]